MAGVSCGCESRLADSESDEIVGLIYIGSATQPTDERSRPALEDVVSYL
ncbi:MAG: hypothetical protein HND48_08000 [Chloroflexi bacterium]|nr:hypothetical protein [Chloroflexota bacterium]